MTGATCLGWVLGRTSQRGDLYTEAQRMEGRKMKKTRVSLPIVSIKMLPAFSIVRGQGIRTEDAGPE